MQQYLQEVTLVIKILLQQVKYILQTYGLQLMIYQVQVHTMVCLYMFTIQAKRIMLMLVTFTDLTTTPTTLAGYGITDAIAAGGTVTPVSVHTLTNKTINTASNTKVVVAPVLVTLRLLLVLLTQMIQVVLLLHQQ